MADHAKQKLVDFLEDHAFSPVLRAKPHQYAASQQRMLEDVQRATRAEIDRFRDYRSAEDVVINFKRDLSSGAAEKIHRELRRLNLPTVNDLEGDFMRLADDLGVRASAS
ncbi:MAG TPA: hypothetical protein VF194_01645 [Ferrovibrio sp.]|jgi:hypothetical protein|uniref:hypothetical protein n=1 Tax=Ferrovibrio sp. TaxID=1917215 RepID=UPI002ED54BA1